MRSIALAALFLVAGGLSAEVPLESLSWQSDSAKPSEAGIAGRVQAYFLVDMSEESGGKQVYWGVRHHFQSKYGTNHQVLHILVGSNGDIPIKGENEKEYWCKATDNSNSLLRAFAGDATAAQVVVDGTGRVVKIARLSSNADKALKDIEALFPTAKPLVANEGEFPLGCKPALVWMKLGDLKMANKEAKKLGKDGDQFTKTITDRVAEILEGDAKVASDPAASPSARLIAMQRMERLKVEYPTVAAAAVAAGIKAAKAAKEVDPEEAAFAAFQDYVKSMKKVSLKKLPDVMKAKLADLIDKHSGTYAAELAVMIEKAAMLPSVETTATK